MSSAAGACTEADGLVPVLACEAARWCWSPETGDVDTGLIVFRLHLETEKLCILAGRRGHGQDVSGRGYLRPRNTSIVQPLHRIE